MNETPEPGRGPLVSVVIAAYNAEGFVKRAIDAALGQVAIAVEVVVVDDASTDGTADHVATLAASDQRIRLVRLDRNAGPAAARNRGFAASRGDWVAVLDADDSYRPERLRRLVDLATEQDADIVADNFVRTDPATGIATAPALVATPSSQTLDLYTFLDGARPYAGEADFGLLKPVFRKSYLVASGVAYPTAVRHGEDFELILRALNGGARYVLDRADALYEYTQRSSGWSRTRVDYSGQVARTRALAAMPEFAADPQLVAKLEARAQALERLERDLQERQRRARAGPIARLFLDLRSPAGRRRLTRKLSLGRLGRP